MTGNATGTRPAGVPPFPGDRAYVVWLNGGADRKATVYAQDELAAARVFWGYDNRRIKQPTLYVWVREKGTRRAICVTLNPQTGASAYADHVANAPDD